MAVVDGKGGAAARQRAEELKKKLKDSPGDVATILALADALTLSGERREAVLMLNKSGAFLQNRGRQMEAIAVYKKVRQVDPQGDVTMGYLSQLELKKLLEEARAQAEKAAAQVESGSQKAAPEPTPAGVPAARPAAPAGPSPEDQKKIAERKAKKEALASLVSGIPLLKDIPPFQFELVLDRIHMRMLEKGAFLFREGEAGASIIFIAAGSLRVTMRAHGGEIEVSRLGAGDIAGEVSFLSNIPRTASLQALTDVAVLELERQAVDQVVRRNRALATALTNLYRERVLDSVLVRCVLFSGLPKEERDRFALRFVPVEAKAGDRVVVEGEPGDAIFILRRGQVRVSRFHRGSEIPLALMGPPDVFGDVAAMRGTPRTATVTAVTPCEFLRLSREDLRELLERNPSIRGKLEEIQLARFINTAEKLNG